MVNLRFGVGMRTLKTVTLIFKLPYYTQRGQSLLICGSEPVLGSWNVKQGLPLSPLHQGDELIWWGKVAVSIDFKCEYNYYVVDDARNVLRSEAGKKRCLILPEGIQEGEIVEIHNLWQDASESLFLRSAFKNVIFGGEKNLQTNENPVAFKKSLEHHDAIGVQFVISCPRLEEGASIYVTGNPPQLGHWKASDGLKLRYVGDSIWKGDCTLPKVYFPIQYKYCQVIHGNGTSLEIGPNREIIVDSLVNHPPNCVILADGSFRAVPWRGSGVAIPMFSLRSSDDLGVGEFLDLKLLVDWAVESGFHLVQLLPVTDTSVHGMWWDSYAYSSLSVFALHPLYLRVQALSENMPEEIKEEILRAKEQLDKKDVDYEATMAAKLSIAKKIYDLDKAWVLKSSSLLRMRIG